MATTSKQQLVLQVHGLFSNPSTFTAVPLGALKVADNIVLDRENLVMPRRGMARYGSTLGATGIASMFSFANALITYTQDGKLWYDSDNNGTWIAYPGTYIVPDSTQPGSRIRSVESNKNFYFLTDSGVKKLDVLTNAPREAGAPPGLGGAGTMSGSTGFLPPQTSVAYRILWGYKDANENLILGAPSDRIIVYNTNTLVSGIFTNVNLSFQIPDEVNETWFYQIYRSLPSVDLLTQPNDELQQVSEGACTSAQLLARIGTVSDVTPQNLLQQYLYTNPSQEGILQANYEPPFARDACFYKNFTFYANTRTVHRFNGTLISSEAPLGLQIGDTISFTLISGGTFTITGGASENTATGQFQVFNTGNPGLDIQNTSYSICKVVNTFSANVFLDAYYKSSFEDLPGQIMFGMETLTITGFHMNVSRPSAWLQVIPVSGTGADSTNDVSQNRIYYSKELQPEAVPLLNYVEVGSKNQPINRIIPLRDGIIILKQDGVFRLSGSGPSSFTITGLDNSVRILADNSAAVLDNQVFFLSDQGVVAASDNAVQIFSRPIERELLKLTSPAQYPNFKDLVFATTYNADRKYILHMPIAGSDTFCRQQYCYNTITNTWTRWTRETLSGIVDIRDNKLYFGGPNNLINGGYVFQERKTYTSQDFADEQYTINIISIAGNVLSISSTTNLAIGMYVSQANSAAADTITAIGTGTITVKNIDPWIIGTAIAYTPIACVLQTVQIDAENPGVMKHFPEISFLFSEADFTSMNVSFSSDMSGSWLKQVLKPLSMGNFGQFNFGTAPWGGNIIGQQTRIRTLVPAAHQRCNWINVKLELSQCFTSFGFSGMSIATNAQSSRQQGVD